MEKENRGRLMRRKYNKVIQRDVKRNTIKKQMINFHQELGRYLYDRLEMKLMIWVRTLLFNFHKGNCLLEISNATEK